MTDLIKNILDFDFISYPWLITEVSEKFISPIYIGQAG